MKYNFKVAIAGNPNCGKTTIFNLLTGTHQHVGNYSGVTVERKTGRCMIDSKTEVTIIDLPGIYSLSSASAEEKVAFSELMHEDIGLILNVIDAGNIQRNLYLTTQLAELGIPMLLVFNMSDDAKKRGLAINYDMIAHYFNSPYVEAVGSEGKGAFDIRTMIGFIMRAEKPRLPKALDFSPLVTEAVSDLTSRIEATPLAVNQHIPLRCFAIKLLENDPDAVNNQYLFGIVPEAAKWREKIFARHGAASETFMTDCRYGMIAGACREAITVNQEARRQFSEEIDGVVTNRYLGLPIFLLIMFAVFFLTFFCAEPISNLLGQFFQWLGAEIVRFWPDGHMNYLRSLITEGVIGGVGGVLQFLPNILLLFLGIAFLEGTGYMSRAAFVMDGFMHRFGLHGKSFIPMILGFGCTVPAIMAARTIESRRDRLTTIMILPLISCGARLPIYSLFIPAFFPMRWQAAILWLIYVIGVLLALCCARFLKRTIFKGEDEIFVMELPPYRMPTVRSLLIYMGERGMMYLRKAGTFILGASIIMFLFNTLPGPDASKADRHLAERLQTVQSSPKLSAEAKTAQTAALHAEIKKDELENSISGFIGRKLAVVLHPVGFDWKISSALVGAFAGKELFVSQLGILNSISNSSGDGIAGFQAALRKQYSPLQAFCIMLFCLISIPCAATFAVVRKETDSWGLALLQLCGLTVLAWIVTFLVFQGGTLLCRL